MTLRRLTVATVLLGGFMLSACGAVLVGAGATVIADEVIEEKKGGDGLF